MKLTRVALAIACVVALLGAPLALEGQPVRRPHRIGILHGAYFPGTPSAEGLKAGLKGLGLEEGRDVTYEILFTRGRLEASPAAAETLVKSGVDVVFPNPFSSGGARWDVMAAYGSQLREGKTPKQAQAYLKTLFQHNVSQDTSGRNALNTFLSGKGDVLLDYESDAKLAQSQGKPVYYLIPKATLQIETPLAVTNGSNKAVAQKFASWLYTPAAQTIWAENGFRPSVLSVFRQYTKQFPPRPQLFKIGYVGGWDKVNTQFFDPTNGIVAKIEQSLGVSTGG